MNSALVEPDTAASLMRSLQSAENPYEYGLPYEDTDLEVNVPPYRLLGWLDDVISVGGHRLSTTEVESALAAHDKVAEAAVVGRPDELKGQALAAFVTLEQGYKPTPELKEELRAWVAQEIGELAKPDDIRFTDVLPKTRSGKIMRQLLRELAGGGAVKGDVSALADPGVLARLKEEE